MFHKIKIVLLALVVAVLLPMAAQAQTYYTTTTGTLGDKNSSGDYRVTLTNDGVVHYASDTGITMPYLTPTSTDQTLTAAQTGTTFVFNNGSGTAVSGATYTLPAAVAGLQYTFIGDVAKIFRLKPASGEIINYSTDVANSKVKNTSAAIGDSITVICVTAGQWSIKNRFGTWATDNNP